MSYLIQKSVVSIPVGKGTSIEAVLSLPSKTEAVAVFSHVSANGRSSRRNQLITSYLNEADIATLLVDLVADGELAGGAPLGHSQHEELAERLAAALTSVETERTLVGLPVGIFAEGDGAGPAFLLAESEPERVQAMVCRGGRLGVPWLRPERVACPTLLVIGSNDDQAIEPNREVCRRLGGPHELCVVPGAGHAFVESGALEKVAIRASRWFTEYLCVGEAHGLPLAGTKAVAQGDDPLGAY